MRSATEESENPWPHGDPQVTAMQEEVGSQRFAAPQFPGPDKEALGRAVSPASLYKIAQDGRLPASGHHSWDLKCPSLRGASWASALVSLGTGS